MIRERSIGALVLLSALAAPQAPRAAEFSLLPMARAEAVSRDGGSVAGCARTARDACGEAVLWRHDGGLRRLRGLPPGSVASRAHDVADDGTVVGENLSGTGRNAAVRWSPAGRVRELTPLPGLRPFARALAVSADAGVAAGSAGGAALGYAAVHAVLWRELHGAKAIGHLPGDRRLRDPAPFAEVLDLSADGAVAVGWSGGYPGNPRHRAFRRDAAGGLTHLGGLEGGNGHGEARGVNAAGNVVVGTARSAEGMQAFRWSAADGMLALGDLSGGAFESAANAVSADGRVVVGSGSAGGRAGRDAIVWAEDEGLMSLERVLREEYCLDLAGAHLVAALDVSDDGRVIVGAARDAGGRPRAFRAVLDYAPGTNRAPQALADSYWTIPGDELVVSAAAAAALPPPASPGRCPAGRAPPAGVLLNDGDPEGHPLIAELVEDVAHGTLVLRPDGGFRYTAAAGFLGQDRFIYRASDGRVASAPVTVEIGVGNTPPGTEVAVAPGGGVGLRFARVTVGGHTTLEPGAGIDPPEGFQEARSGAAWGFASSAVHLGLVRFTTGYEELELAGWEGRLRMLHYRDGVPDPDPLPGRIGAPDPPGNVTVDLDTQRNSLSGEMRAPSVVALVLPETSGALLPWIILLLLVGAAPLVLLWLSRMRAEAQG